MIEIIGSQIPSVPEDFKRRLQQFDKDLIVCWHKSPFTRQSGRWKIERCFKHRSDGGPHDHLCQRVYILMCQDDEGTPLPLGDWVFTKLREMRSNWEAKGGDSERGIRNALAESDSLDHSLAQKREVDEADMLAYNRKDKRIQINKLVHLVQQHDVRPN